MKYDKGNLSKKLKELNKKHGYDYIEIIFNIDDLLYPFIPPSIEYSKPYMSPVVVHNLKSISFFDYKNWNSNITLEWIITQIAIKFEEYFEKYIDIDKQGSSENEIDRMIFKIFNIMGVNQYEDLGIKFELPNFKEKEKGKYWNSGTGYGYNGTNAWDINNFIIEQQEQNKNVMSHLQTIINLYNDEKSCKNKEEVNNKMTDFIKIQLKGTTILDINKNKELYVKYLECIEELGLTCINIGTQPLDSPYSIRPLCWTPVPGIP